MRAVVIKRATGEPAGEIEAETTYALFQALLDWGERQGLPRFQVPIHYRTERQSGPATPDAPAAPTTPGSPPAPADGATPPSPLPAKQTATRRARRRGDRAPAAATEPEPAAATEPEPVAPVEAPADRLTDSVTTEAATPIPLPTLAVLLATEIVDTKPSEAPRRSSRRRRPADESAPSVEQLRLF